MRAQIPRIPQANASLFQINLKTITGIDDETQKFLIFLLIVEKDMVPIKPLFQFGYQASQFNEIDELKPSVFPELFKADFVDWMRTSGLAWNLVT
jgi:hypothetical protein